MSCDIANLRDIIKIFEAFRRLCQSTWRVVTPEMVVCEMNGTKTILEDIRNA